MEDKAFVLYNFSLKPGHSVEVEAFIPQDCNRFAINLGKNDKNYALHFNPRFDHLGDTYKIMLNSTQDGVWGVEKKVSFFPFQEGSDTKVIFKFEPNEIIIKLPTGNPLSFPLRYPIMEISYLSMQYLQLKSITLK